MNRTVEQIIECSARQFVEHPVAESLRPHTIEACLLPQPVKVLIAYASN